MPRDAPSEHAVHAGGRREAMLMVIEVVLIAIRLISSIIGLAARCVQLAIRIADLHGRASEKTEPGE